MLNPYTSLLLQKKDLNDQQTREAFEIILQGEASPVQIAAFLVALRCKGETVAEITEAAKVMREVAHTVEAPEGTMDTCGTGGDHSGSYNISTAVALVVAAAGVPVAKHGNRSVSSKSGSADVLQALGVNIEADPAVMVSLLKREHFGFFMAPVYHPAMRHVAPVRKELGLRTVFNMLGPLCNPAPLTYQLLGVYDVTLVQPFAQVLRGLGVKSAWVVHGGDGMDELTTTSSSYVAQLKDGKIESFTIEPENYGLRKATTEDLKGGDAKDNAIALLALLQGKGDIFYRDIVMLNAGAALVVAEEVRDLAEGIARAGDVLDSGAAKALLDRLIEKTGNNE